MTFEEFKKKYEKVPVERYPNAVSDKPLVSVCVQTYNHAVYIRQCLDGILMQQTDFDFEILLGEDDSADGTRKICIEYADKYPDKIRLFLHRRENNIRIGGGPTGRFNFLYNVFSSTCKYLALCEGDDYWTDPLKLQKQVNILENDCSLAGCFHDVKVLKRRGTVDSFLIDNGNFDYNQTRLVNLENLFKSKWLIPTCSFVFRRGVLTLPDFFCELVFADAALFTSVSACGPIFFMVDNMGVYRRNNANSMTNLASHFNRIRMSADMIRFIIWLNKQTDGRYNDLIAMYIELNLAAIKKSISTFESSGAFRLTKLILRIRKKLKVI